MEQPTSNKKWQEFFTDSLVLLTESPWSSKDATSMRIRIQQLRREMVKEDRVEVGLEIPGETMNVSMPLIKFMDRLDNLFFKEDQRIKLRLQSREPLQIGIKLRAMVFTSEEYRTEAMVFRYPFKTQQRYVPLSLLWTSLEKMLERKECTRESEFSLQVSHGKSEISNLPPGRVHLWIQELLQNIMDELVNISYVTLSKPFEQMLSLHASKATSFVLEITFRHKRGLHDTIVIEWEEFLRIMDAISNGPVERYDLPVEHAFESYKLAALKGTKSLATTECDCSKGLLKKEAQLYIHIAKLLEKSQRHDDPGPSVRCYSQRRTSTFSNERPPNRSPSPIDTYYHSDPDAQSGYPREDYSSDTSESGDELPDDSDYRGSTQSENPYYGRQSSHSDGQFRTNPPREPRAGPPPRVYTYPVYPRSRSNYRHGYPPRGDPTGRSRGNSYSEETDNDTDSDDAANFGQHSHRPAQRRSSGHVPNYRNSHSDGQARTNLPREPRARPPPRVNTDPGYPRSRSNYRQGYPPRGEPRARPPPRVYTDSRYGQARPEVHIPYHYRERPTGVNTDPHRRTSYSYTGRTSSYTTGSSRRRELLI